VLIYFSVSFGLVKCNSVQCVGNTAEENSSIFFLLWAQHVVAFSRVVQITKFGPTKILWFLAGCDGLTQPYNGCKAVVVANT